VVLLLVALTILLALAALLVFGPHRVEAFLNRRQWFLPLLAVVLMLAIFGQLTGIQQGQHDDQVASCERGNVTRVAEVLNLEEDKLGLQADIDFARRVAPPSRALVVYVAKKEERIKGKQKAINSKAASQARYAIEPGSVVIDCEAAF
jgi:hypothetical protein